MIYYKITGLRGNEVVIAASDAAADDTVEELLAVLTDEGIILGWEPYEMMIV